MSLDDKKIAQTALDVQNAVNITAVARTLMDVLHFLRDCDTNTKCTHPAVVLIVDKLHDMCGRETSYARAYDSCHAAVSGDNLRLLEDTCRRE